MSEEEINEALKIIKEPITVNSIEYKYFNQENYEKLSSVYENAKWFVSNWEQALQNIKDLQQKVEQLEKENFNIRENIHLERISLPPALTKDKDFMELYDIPSYEDLQQKVEQLEKELQTNVNKCNQLENIRKEAIEWCKCVINSKTTAGELPNGKRTDMGYCLDLAEPLLKILEGGDE